MENFNNRNDSNITKKDKKDGGRYKLENEALKLKLDTLYKENELLKKWY